MIVLDHDLSEVFTLWDPVVVIERPLKGVYGITQRACRAHSIALKFGYYHLPGTWYHFVPLYRDQLYEILM